MVCFDFGDGLFQIADQRRIPGNRLCRGINPLTPQHLSGTHLPGLHKLDGMAKLGHMIAADFQDAISNGIAHSKTLDRAPTPRNLGIPAT